MKKIATLLIVFFWVIGVYAQNPYVGATTVTADGITFEVDLSKYVLYLSNVANIYDNAFICYKDGRELETEDEYSAIGAEIVDVDKEYRAIRETFGDDVINALRVYKESTMIIFYVVGHDGATWEVAFIMDAVPELLSLSPDVYANLEKKLKQNVRWQANKYSQDLQFFHICSCLNFKEVPLSSETIRLKPNLGFEQDLGIELGRPSRNKE